MAVRSWRHTALLSATALIAAAALAGCGASGESSDTSSLSGGAPAMDRAAPEPAGAEGTASEAKAPNLSVDQRAIVYTGSITVRVDDVNQAAAKVTAIAAGAGGFVGGDKRSSGSGAAEASLELRVPAAKFSGVVDQLAGLGTEEQRGISTDDVTEETLDLDARIATQQARVASGRRLLSQAKSLNELVMLEGEVAKREADLASLTAKKRRLDDLTALSTITAVLLDPEAVARTDDDPAGFLGGLAGGWKALLASLGVLLTVLGALVPWVIALGLPLWGAIWLFRRYGRRTPGPAPALATAGPSLPPYPPRDTTAHVPAAQVPAPQTAAQAPTAQAPAAQAPAAQTPPVPPAGGQAPTSEPTD